MSGQHRPARAIGSPAEQLDRHLRQTAPQFYAGTVVGADGHLVVRLVMPPDDEEPLVQSMREYVAALGQHVETRSARWAIADLETATERIAQAVSQRHDLQLSRWGVDIEANRVRIGYLGERAAMARVLEELGYDDDLVFTEKDTSFSPSF